jgi:hypothetical protein
MDLLGSKFNYGANMRLSEEDAIIEMAQDGWLMHGVEGMSDAQEKCYTAYLALTTNV